MRYFGTLILTVFGLAQFVVPQADPIDETGVQVKLSVTKLVETQRSNKLWMQMTACPADSTPEHARRPKLSARDCSDDPQGCLKACNGGSADSCHALARLIQDKDSIANDVADVLYRKSCRFGLASGCTNAAAKLFDSTDKRALSCAARTFDLTCDKNDPWGCTMKGLALATGVGRKKDITNAKLSLQKACEIAIDKSAEACVSAKKLLTTLERPQD